jgi:excisionase family DNA binding protein
VVRASGSVELRRGRFLAISYILLYNVSCVNTCPQKQEAYVEERHYSLSEVARILGKSERTVRRWIKLGTLRAYKPGRDYLIPESALRELLEGSEVPKAEPPLPFNQVAEERGGVERQRRSFFADAIIAAADKWISIVEDPSTNDQKRFGIADAANELADYAVEHVDEEVWDALTNAERRELIGVQEKLSEVVEQVCQHIEGRQAEEEVAERREKIKKWTRQLSA